MLQLDKIDSLKFNCQRGKVKMIFRNLLNIECLAIFCLIFIIGCGPPIPPNGNGPIPPNGNGPIPPNGNGKVPPQIVYIPVNPVKKLSHDESVKWLRDNGYSVETNNQKYIIRGQHGSNNTNLDISVGATVIIPVYDKFSMNVGWFSVIDGKISVTINQKRTVKPVN